MPPTVGAVEVVGAMAATGLGLLGLMVSVQAPVQAPELESTAPAAQLEEADRLETPPIAAKVMV